MKTMMRWREPCELQFATNNGHKKCSAARALCVILVYFLSRFQWYGAGDYDDEDGDDDDDGDDVDGDADDHDDGGVDKISPLVAAQ